jgi:ketosteroid isomerase-like protein
MSANLDLVRSIYAAWERGDFSSAEWANPDIEFVAIGGPAQARAHGIPGMAREMREFLTAWEGYRSEAEEYRELDRQRVLVLTLDSGRGKQSDLATEQRRASVYLIRSGKVSRITTYWDRNRALADLGLPPEGEQP